MLYCLRHATCHAALCHRRAPAATGGRLRQQRPRGHSAPAKVSRLKLNLNLKLATTAGYAHMLSQPTARNLQHSTRRGIHMSPVLRVTMWSQGRIETIRGCVTPVMATRVDDCDACGVSRAGASLQAHGFLQRRRHHAGAPAYTAVQVHCWRWLGVRAGVDQSLC
jgi:hypothetical protein